jgi:hypothetical protein
MTGLFRPEGLASFSSMAALKYLLSTTKTDFLLHEPTLYNVFQPVKNSKEKLQKLHI